eukprot:2629000-Prymnesium_polylepis.2
MCIRDSHGAPRLVPRSRPRPDRVEHEQIERVGAQHLDRRRECLLDAVLGVAARGARAARLRRACGARAGRFVPPSDLCF